MSSIETSDSHWKSLYRFGGTTALLVVLIALSDIIISFIPGGATNEPGTVPVVDWFTLFQNNWFLGLRALGLLNIVNLALTTPIFLALYDTHRRVNKAYAALAAVLFFVGAAVYIAQNTAFPILALSGQYAAATTESERSLLVAAGKAVLAQGEDLTPGTFMGFFLTEVAGIFMALVMFRSRIFSRLTALAGILAYGLLLIFNICAAFVPAIYDVAVLVFGTGGGLLIIAWNILIARRLFQLGRAKGGE